MALFLEDISKLYEIEGRATAEGLGPAERLELRRRESRPIVVTLMRLTSGWLKTYSQSGKVAEQAASSSSVQESLFLDILMDLGQGADKLPVLAP